MWAVLQPTALQQAGYPTRESQENVIVDTLKMKVSIAAQTGGSGLRAMLMDVAAALPNYVPGEVVSDLAALHAVLSAAGDGLATDVELKAAEEAMLAIDAERWRVASFVGDWPLGLRGAHMLHLLLH
eukprot:2423514-Pyramimonas_sp.AAC.1